MVAVVQLVRASDCGADYRVPYMCHNVGEIKKRKLKY